MIIIIIIIIVPLIWLRHTLNLTSIIHVYLYKYNEQPVSQDSNIAAHTLPCRTATTQGFSTGK